MKTTELSDKLAEALHIYQEVGGTMEAIIEQVNIIISQLPAESYAAYRLHDWAISLYGGDEKAKYDALAHIYFGLLMAAGIDK